MALRSRMLPFLREHCTLCENTLRSSALNADSLLYAMCGRKHCVAFSDDSVITALPRQVASKPAARMAFMRPASLQLQVGLRAPRSAIGRHRQQPLAPDEETVHGKIICIEGAMRFCIFRVATLQCHDAPSPRVRRESILHRSSVVRCSFQFTFHRRAKTQAVVGGATSNAWTGKPRVQQERIPRHAICCHPICSRLLLRHRNCAIV